MFNNSPDKEYERLKTKFSMPRITEFKKNYFNYLIISAITIFIYQSPETSLM